MSFDFSHRLGIFILVEASVLSATAVTGLLCYIAYSTVTIRKGSVRRWRLESPIHLYFLNQLVCDLIQAIGEPFPVSWTRRRSHFCRAAGGIMNQIGDVGTALSVALFTFTTLIFRWKPDTNVPRGVLVVVGIWIFIALAIGINVGVNGSKFYGFGPGEYWCWISHNYSVQRTVVDFLWMWISAFFSILAYVPAFLVLTGYIRVEGMRIYIMSKAEAPAIPPSHRLAYNMLFYPTVYIITVLPLTVVRYSTFAGHHPPFAATVAVDTLFLLSGLLNVLLYVITRPFLLPHGNRGLGSMSMRTTNYEDDYGHGESQIPHIQEPSSGALGRDSPDIEGKMFDDDIGVAHSVEPSFASSDSSKPLTSLWARS
ncbi:hypothetical protein FA95DRAFT_1481521 [Auriscalpium vulgare]|uniref:Uncharacterized protein n=1 Tax=Auriscalpium vulgare TaxID=40419 RepID=A0ACB8SA56_9AGAM|nr:hypothetical protein FA95DRAFT_1481521 [Auriscalpium vulgare]